MGNKQILGRAMNVLILQCCVFFFFFVSVYTRTCRNNALISNCGVFKSAGENQKKIKEKPEFLRKTSFRPNRFFYMICR
ncbi:Uncharacterized protein FWK35_00029034 [Aphis craccivora]|uniref:Uncharacterized protein n=1 Tax=Aphis craccivora TaxID=307492 RepID=A0A6G0Y0A9_APHCR|nr:Uncharacterized protein FWK35_00029034 [Aphis craccivora]